MRYNIPLRVASWVLTHKVQCTLFVFLIGLWAFHLEEVVRLSMIPNRENLELRLFPHDAAIPTLAHPSDELYHPLDEQDDFTIVTAGSHGYMDRLENMIGSIHFYEPNVKVVVVDVGLSAAQRAALSCLDQVSVIPFDFLRYPDHVRHLDNYAWKPILIKKLYEDYPNGFLYMDSGCEVRQKSYREFQTPHVNFFVMIFVAVGVIEGYDVITTSRWIFLHCSGDGCVHHSSWDSGIPQNIE
jgi:hypothetical protein